MQYPYWEHAGHGHPFGWLLVFLLLALVVGAVVALAFRWRDGRQAGALRLAPAGTRPADNALDIVRLRYARGEIDRDQFLQASTDLGGGGTYPAAEPPPDDAPTAA